MKTMKNSIWMMGIMMFALVGFTSCEFNHDESIGYDVRGHWFGDLDMWIDGEKARGSEIEFLPNGWGYTYGTGVEVDYYRYRSITHRFDYRIRNGVIYMQFDDPNLDCAIVDYRLSYTNFSGYIANYYTLENQTYFNLRSYDKYWDQYGYGGYYDPYYYVKGEMADSTATTGTETKPKCIRGVNRMKD